MAGHMLHPSHRDHLNSLAPGKALRRAFGGMTAFLSFNLLGIGAYLIRDQFRDPLNSHPAGLLFAAVLIATALVLLSYVFHPGDRRQPRHASMEWPEVTAGPLIELQVQPTRKPPTHGAEMPVPSRYVDHARICLSGVRPAELQENSVLRESAGDVTRGRQ